jgi:hypothetical protein
VIHLKNKEVKKKDKIQIIINNIMVIDKEIMIIMEMITCKEIVKITIGIMKLVNDNLETEIVITIIGIIIEIIILGITIKIMTFIKEIEITMDLSMMTITIEITMMVTTEEEIKMRKVIVIIGEVEIIIIIDLKEMINIKVEIEIIKEMEILMIGLEEGDHLITMIEIIKMKEEIEEGSEVEEEEEVEADSTEITISHIMTTKEAITINRVTLTSTDRVTSITMTILWNEITP